MEKNLYKKYSILGIKEIYYKGYTFFDTAEVYIPNLQGKDNKELIAGKTLKEVRDTLVIFTKLFLKSSEIINGYFYGTIKIYLLSSMKRL